MIEYLFLKTKGLTLALIFICSGAPGAYGQVQFSFLEKEKSQENVNSFLFSQNPLQEQSFLKTTYPTLLETFSLFKNNSDNFSQPKAYAYCDLAFFCKIEVQLEKAAKIPVKFRLGDVRYVDYLEQKTDSPK